MVRFESLNQRSCLALAAPALESPREIQAGRFGTTGRGNVTIKQLPVEVL